MNHDKELLEYRLVLETYHAKAQALGLTELDADKVLARVIQHYPDLSVLGQFKRASARLPFLVMGLPETEEERIEVCRQFLDGQPEPEPELPLPGEIVLLRIGGIVGLLVWVLQALNGDVSRWTHAAVMLDDYRVWEAQPGGSVMTSWSKYEGRKYAVVRKKQVPANHDGGPNRYDLAPLNLTQLDRKRIVDQALELGLGVGYSWTTYFYLAAYRVGIRPQWLKDRVQNTDHLICSQGADEIYALSDIHLFVDGRMAYDVSPGDLARLT